MRSHSLLNEASPTAWAGKLRLTVSDRVAGAARGIEPSRAYCRVLATDGFVVNSRTVSTKSRSGVERWARLG